MGAAIGRSRSPASRSCSGRSLGLPYRVIAATHGVGDVDRHRARSRRRRLPRLRLPVGLRALGGRHRRRRDARRSSAPTSCGRSATTTSIRRTSPATTSSRPTATTASSRRRCWLLVLLLLPATTGVLLLHLRGDRGCTALFVFCTNQFHKWAHTKNPARWVRLLQRAGLILSPEHHVDPPHRAARQVLLHHRRLDEPGARQDPLLPVLRGGRCRASTRARCGPHPADRLRTSGRRDRDAELTEPVDAEREEATCGIGRRKRLSARLESET